MESSRVDMGSMIRFLMAKKAMIGVQRYNVNSTFKVHNDGLMALVYGASSKTPGRVGCRKLQKKKLSMVKMTLTD